VTEAVSAGASMPDEWCEHHFDHLSPELGAALPGTLSKMRSLCPVAHSDSYDGFWVITRYEDVLQVAQDWGSFSSAHGLSVIPSKGVVRNLPVEVDPPEQRIYKKLINPYFTPAAVAPYEKATRELVTRLIDEFIEDGHCDFMDAFARRFPSLAFFELALNAPAEELDKVAYLASKSSTPNDPEAGECWAGLYAWIKAFVETRRSQAPRGDVVDGVVNATIDGRPITEDEVIGTIQLLILGGLETTAGALGQMINRFCLEPEIPAQLRRDPERIPAAIEELLRLDSPFIAVGRTVVQDAEVGGRQIKNGEKVLVYWSSANRDEGEFPDADQFDLDRARNRHFAFGVGPHRCAGSNLARLNLRVALEEIVGRLDDIRLAEGAEIHWHSTLTRSPLHLPITFTTCPALGAL
jgi:cytochrome P450